MHDDRQDKPDESPMRKVGAAVAVFYVAALLLNAEGLLRNAERLAYGPLRQHCIALSAPVAGLARRLGVTKLRSGIERVMTETTKGVTE
jgi:hypothetical protein